MPYQMATAPQGVTSNDAKGSEWDAARVEGESYRRRFEAHVQMVFSRVQHHWHTLLDGQRVLLRYCIADRDSRRHSKSPAVRKSSAAALPASSAYASPVVGMLFGPSSAVVDVNG